MASRAVLAWRLSNTMERAVAVAALKEALSRLRRVRLRAAGWRIWRPQVEMTLRDAATTRFGQWWRRTMRGGYAFAEGVYLHGAPRAALGRGNTLVRMR
jgi:hypothetical protein